VLALCLVLPACAQIRDPDPFSATIEYEEGPGGSVTVSPLEIKADTNFGLIQIVNSTNSEHGFAIRELGVFEKIPKGRTRTVSVSDVRDNRTYVFECHLHDNEFKGSMVVKYVAEEER